LPRESHEERLHDDLILTGRRYGFEPLEHAGGPRAELTQPRLVQDHPPHVLLQERTLEGNRALERVTEEVNRTTDVGNDGSDIFELAGMRVR
jgi:hypothetical protein